MVSGVQPKFGAIQLNYAGAGRPLLGVTLTDGDRILKPEAKIMGRALDEELPDTFTLSLDPSTPERAKIGFYSESRGYGRDGFTTPEQLKPLIKTMTERRPVDEELARKFTEHHGLTIDGASFYHLLSEEEIEKSPTEYWAMSAKTAREMARFPNVTFPVAQGDRKDFFRQDYQGITNTFNAFRQWVGLEPHPEEPIASSAVTDPIGRKPRSRFRLPG